MGASAITCYDCRHRTSFVRSLILLGAHVHQFSLRFIKLHLYILVYRAARAGQDDVNKCRDAYAMPSIFVDTRLPHATMPLTQSIRARLHIFMRHYDFRQSSGDKRAFSAIANGTGRSRPFFSAMYAAATLAPRFLSLYHYFSYDAMMLSPAYFKMLPRRYRAIPMRGIYARQPAGRY